MKVVFSTNACQMIVYAPYSSFIKMIINRQLQIYYIKGNSMRFANIIIIYLYMYTYILVNLITHSFIGKNGRGADFYN